MTTIRSGLRSRTGTVVEPDHRQRAMDHAEQAEGLLCQAVDADRPKPLSVANGMVARAHVHADLAHFWLAVEQVDAEPLTAVWTDDDVVQH